MTINAFLQGSAGGSDKAVVRQVNKNTNNIQSLTDSINPYPNVKKLYYKLTVPSFYTAIFTLFTGIGPTDNAGINGWCYSKSQTSSTSQLFHFGTFFNYQGTYQDRVFENWQENLRGPVMGNFSIYNSNTYCKIIIRNDITEIMDFYITFEIMGENVSSYTYYT